MKFIEFGDGCTVDGLNIIKTVIVTDDLSKIETFVKVGSNGRVANVNADGNEVHTPESYANKLKLDRGEFFEAVQADTNIFKDIKNDLVKRKIANSLAEAERQELTAKGERNFKEILADIKNTALSVGAAVLGDLITKYLG